MFLIINCNKPKYFWISLNKLKGKLSFRPLNFDWDLVLDPQNYHSLLLWHIFTSFLFNYKNPNSNRREGSRCGNRSRGLMIGKVTHEIASTNGVMLAVVSNVFSQLIFQSFEFTFKSFIHGGKHHKHRQPAASIKWWYASKKKKLNDDTNADENRFCK